MVLFVLLVGHYRVGAVPLSGYLEPHIIIPGIVINAAHDVILPLGNIFALRDLVVETVLNPEPAIFKKKPRQNGAFEDCLSIDGYVRRKPGRQAGQSDLV